MTTLVTLAVILAVGGLYFYNRERINRVFRVNNKKAMDKIDDPMTKLEDYMERIKKSQQILSEDNKELYKAKRATEDAIKDKEKQVEEYRTKAKYNKESNPELAKKYLAQSFKYKEQISNMEQKIVSFTKRMDQNRSTQEDLNFKREELMSVYQDAKRNAQFAKIGTLSEILSSDNYTELNILITDVEANQRAESYEHDYVSEMNSNSSKTYLSAQMEEEFDKL